MNLILFFGSGVSFPAGMPQVGDLTQCVLDNKYWKPQGDGSGHYHTKKQVWNRDVSQIQRFLRHLYEHYSSFLEAEGNVFDGEQTNYEDLFHLCQEIQWMHPKKDSSIWEVVNKLEHITEFSRKELGELASLAQELIERVVWEELSKEPDLENGSVKGYALLEKLIEATSVDTRINRLNIVTLNHDLLVEKILAKQCLESGSGYEDGFGMADKNMRFHDPKSFFNSKKRVSLIKLHGSINWYSDGDRNYIRQGTDEDIFAEGLNKMLRPQFLTGMNKELIYNSGIFAHMYEAFLNALRHSQHIVISGFGWNDIGVYLMLRNWLLRDKKNKIVLLHNPSKEVEKFKINIIKQDRLKWYQPDQVVLIPKWFGATDFDELMAALYN